jgi:hypothetical protein
VVLGVAAGALGAVAGVSSVDGEGVALAGMAGAGRHPVHQGGFQFLHDPVHPPLREQVRMAGRLTLRLVGGLVHGLSELLTSLFPASMRVVDAVAFPALVVSWLAHASRLPQERYHQSALVCNVVITMTTQQTKDEIRGFFAQRLPEGWFDGEPDMEVDDDEILVVGRLPGPLDADRVAESARITEWREETRGKRMAIAAEAEASWDRKVSWGARCGEVTKLFTTLSVPVMTRLRLRDRAVLDTLVEAGVARSRSEALAWCVRLVGSHEADWLRDLQEALVGVRRVRAEGPTLV